MRYIVPLMKHIAKHTKQNRLGHGQAFQNNGREAPRLVRNMVLQDFTLSNYISKNIVRMNIIQLTKKKIANFYQLTLLHSFCYLYLASLLPIKIQKARDK